MLFPFDQTFVRCHGRFHLTPENRLLLFKLGFLLSGVLGQTKFDYTA